MFVTSPSVSVSESSLQGIAVLPDVTRIIMDTLNQRFYLLIDDVNLGNYLEIIRLLLRFGVNGIINYGILYHQPSEEVIRNLNGSPSLGAIFKFILDFLAHYITLYFIDKKYTSPLIFTIHVAASIPSQFPQFAEGFLIQSFVTIFNAAINACSMVWYMV